MKKLLLSVFAFFMMVLVATPVLAANKSVTIGEVTASTTSISVKGTTEAIAVAVQIRDKDNNIVAMDTAGTVGGAFEKAVAGTYTEGAKYTMYIADYEGGDWSKQEVEIKKEEKKTNEEKSEEKTETPKMGDPMNNTAIICIIGGVLLLGTLLVLKKSKMK